MYSNQSIGLINLCRIFILIVFAIVGCGGGGGNATNNSNGGATDVAAGIKVTNTNGMTVISGEVATGLQIIKVFKPGIFLITPDSGIITQNNQIFTLPIVPNGIATGSVFVVNDHPYAITSIKPLNNGIEIAARGANFNEVLSDLKLNGELNMTQIDLNRLAIDNVQDRATVLVTPSTSEPYSKSDILGPSLKKDKEIKKESDGCSATLNTVEGAGESFIKCGILFKDVKRNIEVKLEGGIKEPKAKIIFEVFGRKEISNISANPFVSGSINIVSEKSFSTEKVDLDIPIKRIKVPIPETLSFVRVDFPFWLSYSLPLMKLGISGELNIPFSKGELQTPVFTFEAPNIAIDDPLKFGKISLKVADAFYGLKTGMVLVFSNNPIAALPFLGSWTEEKEVTGVGFLSKFGPVGNFSAEYDFDKKISCIKYSLQPAAGISIESDLKTLLGKFDKTLISLLEIFQNPRKDGQLGQCEPEQPTSPPIEMASDLIKITSATCINKPIGDGKLLLTTVELTGTFANPNENNLCSTDGSVFNSIYGVQWRTSIDTKFLAKINDCGTWSKTILFGQLFGIGDGCHRCPNQPKTTNWSGTIPYSSFELGSTPTQTASFEVLEWLAYPGSSTAHIEEWRRIELTCK